jgi:anaerobic selenocysteine-containing dehydrogenase
MLLADLLRARRELDEPRAQLVVVGRRQVRSNNSWMHNLPTLAKGPFRCTALVHPDDARERGLTEGDMATLESNGRRIQVQVELSDEMMAGVISLPHGWGHDLPGAQLQVAAQRPGANLNAVLDEGARDPLSGNAVLSGVPVRLSARVA